MIHCFHLSLLLSIILILDKNSFSTLIYKVVWSFRVVQEYFAQACWCIPAILSFESWGRRIMDSWAHVQSRQLRSCLRNALTHVQLWYTDGFKTQICTKYVAQLSIIWISLLRVCHFVRLNTSWRQLCQLNDSQDTKSHISYVWFFSFLCSFR